MFVSSSLGHLVRSATFTKSQVLHPGIEGTEEVKTQDATAAFTQEMEVETRIATETRERPGGVVTGGAAFSMLVVRCQSRISGKMRYRVVCKGLYENLLHMVPL